MYDDENDDDAPSEAGGIEADKQSVASTQSSASVFGSRVTPSLTPGSSRSTPTGGIATATGSVASIRSSGSTNPALSPNPMPNLSPKSSGSSSVLSMLKGSLGLTSSGSGDAARERGGSKAEDDYDSKVLKRGEKTFLGDLLSWMESSEAEGTSEASAAAAAAQVAEDNFSVPRDIWKAIPPLEGISPTEEAIIEAVQWVVIRYRHPVRVMPPNMSAQIISFDVNFRMPVVDMMRKNLFSMSFGGIFVRPSPTEIISYCDILLHTLFSCILTFCI